MNAELKNDRFKLAYHRLVARALKQNPSLLDEARAVVRGWQRERPRASYVDEWDELLARPLDELRRQITRRTAEATRLRISSPFPLTATRLLSQADRLRLRRATSRPSPR